MVPTVEPVTSPREPQPGAPDGARGTARVEPPAPVYDGLLAGPDAYAPGDGRTDGSASDSGDHDGDDLGLEFATPSDGVLVATVTGELDILTAPRFGREVGDRLPHTSLVVLALDGVTFLGTSGLAALIELREQAHRAGVELRLAGTERKVLRPIGIAGLHHLFDIHDDVAAALES